MLLLNAMLHSAIAVITVCWCYHWFLNTISIFWSIVARIALVKPEKARGVEDVILRAAQMGQITEKVFQSPA